MSLIVERFAAAVQTLVGDGSVKSRLVAAYSEYLADLQQVDLPISSKQAFKELHSALHRAHAVGKVDSVQASVQKMSTRDAWRYAKTIFKLYTELLANEQLARCQAESALQIAEEAPPPRYLVSGGH